MKDTGVGTRVIPLEIAILGYGNVARALCKLVHDRRARLHRLGIELKVTAVAGSSVQTCPRPACQTAPVGYRAEGNGRCRPDQGDRGVRLRMRGRVRSRIPCGWRRGPRFPPLA